jgi:integrase
MQKTAKRVKFRLAEHSKSALLLWIETRPPFSGDWLFPGKGTEGHMSEVHYRRLAKEWFDAAGLDVRDFSTHSLRRTKAAEMYRQTKNIKAISLRLGHRNPAVTAEYLGVDDYDSLDLADKVKI